MRYFEIGQKVWCLSCGALYEGNITSKCPSMDGAYYIRTHRFEQLFCNSSIFAYPKDAKMLIASLEEEIECIESNIREIHDVVDGL